MVIIKKKKILCLGTSLILICSNLGTLLTYAEGFEDSSSDTSISSDVEVSTDTSTEFVDTEPQTEPQTEPEPDPEPEPEPEPDPEPEPEPDVQVEETTVEETTVEETTTTQEIQEAAFMYTLSNNEVVLVGCKTPALEVIDIPELIDGYPVTTISEDVFTECYNAVQINIPYSIKTISEGAFKMCTNLQYIGVATENTHYKSSNGVLYSFDGASIIAYPSDKPDDTYTIAETVMYIGTACFNNCINLESVVLPSELSVIGYSAFNGCINLKELTVNNNVQLSQTMFENCPLEKIYGYENSNAEAFANMYEIEFESIGVLETTEPTTETTIEETTVTETVTTVETTPVESQSVVYYAPERENMDSTEKIVIVIIIVAMVSLVVAIASKSHKNNDEEDDEDEDDDDDDEDIEDLDEDDDDFPDDD